MQLNQLTPAQLAVLAEKASGAATAPFVFQSLEHWHAYTRCFPVQVAVQLQAAWWKLELWSRAVRQNTPCN
ncbi:MAG TPA: hypothetical protein VGY56_10570 [Verrucomicrobiae bacterium]|nr:hypothetical protein [Verrucomicrobiae bacterium]